MKISPRYDGPPLIAIDGAPADQLAPVVRQRRRMETMLAALGADDWKAPSRCEGWTVQDVISHIVGVNNFWELSVRQGLAGTPTRYLVGFDPVATPAQMVGAMRTLTAAEVLDQFVASNDGFLGVLSGLDDDGWMTLAETPPGHLPIRLLASHAVWDTWVHERDIALPLGLTPPVETDEVMSSMRYAAALSPGFILSEGRDSPRFVCGRGARSRRRVHRRHRRLGFRARRRDPERRALPTWRCGRARRGVEHPRPAPRLCAARMARAARRLGHRVRHADRSRLIPAQARSFSIRSSAIATVVRCVFALGRSGITDASHTRSAS